MRLENKWILAGLAAATAYFLFFKKSATAGPPPGPTPAPPPPPAPPAPATYPVTLTPGIMFTPALNLPNGAQLVLQLPQGASWPDVPGIHPVNQTPNSVLGGTVDPVDPSGTESQSWSNLTGNGTIVAAWQDSNNMPQVSTISVATASGPHTLGEGA